MFTGNAEVIRYGTTMLRAMALAAPFVGVIMICMNSLQALGKAIPSLILSSGRQGIVYIPLLFLLSRFFGLTGIIFSQPIVDILVSIAASFMLYHVLRTDTHLAKRESLQ